MTIHDEPLPEKLRAHVRNVEQALERAGVEALARHGILRDLEGQIAEMRAEEGLSDDAILAGLDAPEAFVEACAGKADSAAGRAAAPEPAVPVHSPDSRGGTAYVIVAIIATAAILVEMLTQICASEAFNPIPTCVHLALLLLTPVFIIVTRLSLTDGAAAARIGRLYFMNGFLVAIGLYYAPLFVPLIPVALVAVFFLGLGLLPLAPVMVLITAVCQGMQLRRQAKNLGRRGLSLRWLAGFAATALILAGWHYYEFSLREAMRMAALSDMEKREAGLNRLRLLRGEGYVLAHCFGRASAANRVTYYLLTGRDYGKEKRSSWYFVVDRSRGDARGGSAVGETGKVLSLRSAVYDVSVSGSDDGGNAGPGVAYAEVTLEFANSGPYQEEARCQIILPPGGVASRLTLWIDGEEREAAFGKRSVAREAYTKVVSRRLDPALLTTAGPDRVLLQCFPVMPGQTMRVKAGFSLPLSPEGDRAHMRLPHFAERNFDLDLGKGVSVWVESDAPLSNNGILRREAGNGGATAGHSEKRKVHAVRGYAEFDELAKIRIGLPLPDAPATFRAELAGIAATSELVLDDPLPERLLAVVLDTSRQCEGLWKPGGSGAVSWENALKGIPDGCRVALFAGEAAVPPLAPEEAARRWPEALSRIAYTGADGQMSNLEKAWDLCDGERNAAVVWLHGSMPVDIADTSGLTQRLRRSPSGDGGPAVFSLQVLPGANRLLEKLDGTEGLARLTYGFDESVGERVANLFENALFPLFAQKRYTFTMRDGADWEGAGYGHAVRLAVARETERRLAGVGGGPAGERIRDIVAAALRLRLVTRATGAVVLENAQQYRESSLDPAADADTVPTIPEPEEWAMLAIVALSAVILHRRRFGRKAAA